MTETPSGLKYEDTVVGTGASPAAGQTCVMHYTGWLWVNGAKASKFDSSVDRGRPFEFPIGRGRVIKGWDEGVATMKIGGKRTLLIPPQLGYGDRGAGGVIPPGATLLFEVELLGCARRPHCVRSERERSQIGTARRSPNISDSCSRCSQRPPVWQRAARLRCSWQRPSTRSGRAGADTESRYSAGMQLEAAQRR